MGSYGSYGFSLVTNLNKYCSLLMVLKLNDWRGVCTVIRLDTKILIGTSVWGWEGAKSSTEKPHLTFFLILHNWLLLKLQFWEWHEITRIGIFPMAQNIKTIKLDKIEHFLLKSLQFYIKFWEYIRILWSMCFLEDLICKKISSTSIFAIFLSKAKTKLIKKLPQNHKLVEKRGLSDKRRHNNSYFQSTRP